MAGNVTGFYRKGDAVENLQLPEISRNHLGTSFSVDTCTDDTAGIASPFSTGEEALKAYVHEGIPVAENTDRRTRTCLGGNHHGFVRKEAMRLFPKVLKASCSRSVIKEGIQKWSGLEIRPGA